MFDKVSQQQLAAAVVELANESCTGVKGSQQYISNISVLARNVYGLQDGLQKRAAHPPQVLSPDSS